MSCTDGALALLSIQIEFSKQLSRLEQLCKEKENLKKQKAEASPEKICELDQTIDQTIREGRSLLEEHISTFELFLSKKQECFELTEKSLKQSKKEQKLDPETEKPELDTLIAWGEESLRKSTEFEKYKKDYEETYLTLFKMAFNY